MSTGKAAQLLGVTVKTLQRWEREGRLVPAGRTESNRRKYTESQLRAYLGQAQALKVPSRIVAYCRVSSSAQRPDLANPRANLEQFTVARSLANVEFIEEVGGGLNFSRECFCALMDAIGRDEVATLVPAHRDRLTRFGFEHNAAKNLQGLATRAAGKNCSDTALPVASGRVTSTLQMVCCQL